MNACRILVPVSVIALGVACSAPSQSDGPVGSSSSPIVYGTADTANPHTAVVALLAPDGSGYDQCSGTIIQVKAGLATVLTAAHCCNNTQPSIVVMSNDYSGSVNYISSSSPPAPAYAVIASSVKFDPSYNGSASAPIDDFCLLQFNAPAGTPSIPVAVGTDGLAVGSKVDYVGFGVTTDATNNSNTIRNIASNVTVNTAVTANTFSCTEGNGIGGPCEGDSGGPALVPPGVPQAQQTVVGTTSYGSAKCQPAGSTGVDMRVLSQTGTGGFISTYLGTGTGGDAGTTGGGDAGTSGTAPTTCTEADGTFGCCEGTTNYYCATGATTVTSKTCTGGKVCGWNKTSGYYACVAAPATADPSGMYPLACGGGTTTVPDAGTTTTDAATTSDAMTATDGGSSVQDGGSTTADGAAASDATTGVPDTGSVSTPDTGIIVVGGSDSGLVFTTPDATTTTGGGGGGGDAGDGASGSTGGCSTSGRGAGAPPWFAIGIALVALRARRRTTAAV